MSETAWLQALQPGDKVIVRESGPGQRVSMTTVAKMTKTQCVLHWGKATLRFRLDTGRQIGTDHWHFKHLCPYTEDAATEIRLRQLLGKVYILCSKMSASDVDSLTAEQCMVLLEAFKAVGLLWKEMT